MNDTSLQEKVRSTDDCRLSDEKKTARSCIRTYTRCRHQVAYTQLSDSPVWVLHPTEVDQSQEDRLNTFSEFDMKSALGVPTGSYIAFQMPLGLANSVAQTNRLRFDEFGHISRRIYPL
jgi:hypothetical protein